MSRSSIRRLALHYLVDSESCSLTFLHANGGWGGLEYQGTFYPDSTKEFGYASASRWEKGLRDREPITKDKCSTLWIRSVAGTTIACRWSKRRLS